MSARIDEYVLFGPTAELPAGYARCRAGLPLRRGHTPGLTPDWFGPDIGVLGENRFDPPRPRTPADPGVCYVAESLIGVLLERVLRGVKWPAVSRTTLNAKHSVSDAVLTRDLVTLDLIQALGVHRLELIDVCAPPDLTPGAPLRYPRTQQLAGEWAARNAGGGHPVPGGRVDAILYVSRFGPGARCLAIWDTAREAVDWGSTVPLGSASGLEEACEALDVKLLT